MKFVRGSPNNAPKSSIDNNMGPWPHQNIIVSCQKPVVSWSIKKSFNECAEFRKMGRKKRWIRQKRLEKRRNACQIKSIINKRFIMLTTIGLLALAAYFFGRFHRNIDALEIETINMPENCMLKSRNEDILTIRYAGWLVDGTQFYSSMDLEEQPSKLQLGTGQVIKGLDQGLIDMCVGEKRKLTIPAKLGYGDRSFGTIPSESSLIFEVELIKIEYPPRASELFKEIDKDDDKLLTPDEFRLFLDKRVVTIGDTDTNRTVVEKDEYYLIFEQIFQTTDNDKDGCISFEEFLVMKVIRFKP